MSIRDDSIYVLIHLPKCGGRSVFKMFQEVLGEDKVLDLYANPFDQVDNQALIDGFYDQTIDLSPYKAICGGHIDFMTDRECFQGRTPLFVSVVREPLERFVSYYNYTCMADEKYKDMPGRFPSSNPELVEMARSCSGIEEFYHRLLEDNDPAWNTSNVQSMFLTGTKGCSTDAVIECLDTGYHGVVPLPLIDRLFDQIASENGVELKTPVVENVSVKRSVVSDISPEFRELFRKRADLDYFTYYYVYAKTLNQVVDQKCVELLASHEVNDRISTENAALQHQVSSLEADKEHLISDKEHLINDKALALSDKARLVADKAQLIEHRERLEDQVAALRKRRWLFAGWPPESS